jgi:hypothetical protein
MKLTIELVPSTSWGNNLRTEANLSKERWDTLRRQSYRNAQYRCEICSEKGPTHPVECHEIWHYDDGTKTQTLKGLISLCPTCHKAKHLGRTLSVESPEVQEQVLNKIAVLNEFKHPLQLELYIESVFSKWEERSQHQWTLDLSWLEAGLDLT